MINIAYTYIYFHIIISPHLCCPLHDEHARMDMNRFISEILRKTGNKPIAINGTFDHTHILYSPSLRMSIETMIEKVKLETTQFLDNTGLIKKFGWQEGYLAVTIGKSDVKNMIHHIKLQNEYHQTISFKKEYIGILDEARIEYEPGGLFEFHP